MSMQVYKQKIKHLLYEHQNDVTLLKTDTETSLKLQNDDHREKGTTAPSLHVPNNCSEFELKKQQKNLKSDMKEVELSHQDVITNLKQEHDKNVTKLRQEYERNLKEMQTKYDKKMRQQRDDLELRRKNEIHEVEGIPCFSTVWTVLMVNAERKNSHINDLMKKHDKAFQEIKAYYNDITLNNLELIKSLKVCLSFLFSGKETNNGTGTSGRAEEEGPSRREVVDGGDPREQTTLGTTSEGSW